MVSLVSDSGSFGTAAESTVWSRDFSGPVLTRLSSIFDSGKPVVLSFESSFGSVTESFGFSMDVCGS